MNRFLPFVGAALVALSPFAASADDAHVVVGPDKLSWGPAPPSVPKGAQVAVLSGDPGKSGLYALRLKVPAGYKVPAHTHPTDENITVLSGSIIDLDDSSFTSPPASFVVQTKNLTAAGTSGGPSAKRTATGIAPKKAAETRARRTASI